MKKKRHHFLEWDLASGIGSEKKKRLKAHPFFVFHNAGEEKENIPLDISGNHPMHEKDFFVPPLSRHILDLRARSEQRSSFIPPRRSFSNFVETYAKKKSMRTQLIRFPWTELTLVRWFSLLCSLIRWSRQFIRNGKTKSRFFTRLLSVHGTYQVEVLRESFYRLFSPWWLRQFAPFFVGILVFLVPFGMVIAYQDVVATRDHLYHLTEETVRSVEEASDASARIRRLIAGWNTLLRESTAAKERYRFFLPFVRFFPSYHKELQIFEHLLGEGKDAFAVMEDVFGYTGWRRYLVLFQNNHELRATGGFMGSYALVDIEDGRLKNIDIPPRGPYDLRSAMREHIQSPGPLHYVNPVWEFQDANWWPDWPTSAEKILWFWKNSSGPTIDGIVTVNAGVVEDLLRLTGPVVLPDHDTMITSNNFMKTVQRAVEKEYDHIANTPKQFLGDFAHAFVPRLIESDQRTAEDLIRVLAQSLSRREIQLYSFYPPVQSFIRRFGWDGAREPFASDGLFVVHTNIGGEKTDGVIDERQQLDLVLRHDGSVDHILTINRRHKGKLGEPFSGVPNLDYIRVYVPRESVLLSIEGEASPDSLREREVPPEGTVHDATLPDLETNVQYDPKTGLTTYEENGRKVFAVWSRVDPGQETQVVVSYRVPKEQFYAAPYLTIEKQSGLSPFPLRLVIHIAEGMFWRPNNSIFQEETHGATTTYSLETSMTEDQMITLIRP